MPTSDAPEASIIQVDQGEGVLTDAQMPTQPIIEPETIPETVVNPTEATDTTDPNKTKPQRRSLLIGGTIAGTVAVIAALAYAGKLGGGEEPEQTVATPITTSAPADTTAPEASPEASSPVVETPASPAAEATPKTAQQLIKNPSELTFSIVEMGTYANLSPEQAEWMQTINSLTPEQFALQPREIQTAYGEQIFENVLVTVQYALRQEGITLNYTENPETAQEIMDNYTLRAIAAGWCYEKVVDDYSEPPQFNKTASLGIFSLIRTIDDDAMVDWNTIYGPAASDFALRLTPAMRYENDNRTVLDEFTLADGRTIIETIDANNHLRQAAFGQEVIHAVPEMGQDVDETEARTNNLYLTFRAEEGSDMYIVRE